MKRSWGSGLFGVVIAGLFWLMYSLTGSIGASIASCVAVFIGVNLTLYAFGKRKLQQFIRSVIFGKIFIF